MDTYVRRTDFVDPQKPPVKAGWTCLILAWALFIIPIPGLGFIGWALNLAAFIISIIVMVKGRVGAGVAQMVCSLTVSPIIYFTGLGIWDIICGLSRGFTEHGFKKSHKLISISEK